ncbi:hypothetical protein BDD12DRAFT_43044 [Trichophaea hybrida]|nr:hypothetical protein BDD12DRAFT_43044 [Trichophaea hybrida]
MVYNIFTYHRPNHVKSLSSATDSSAVELRPTQSLSSSSGYRSGIAGIPARLSFDKIIEGHTCPPLTCRDFMNYLLYVEHCAENLQFYLWYRDYVERFEKLPELERNLSPEYSPVSAAAAETIPAPVPAALRGPNSPKVSRAIQRFVSDTFATESARNLNEGLTESPPTRSSGTNPKEGTSPFLTPPGTPLVPRTTRNIDSGVALQFSYTGSPSLSEVNYQQAAAETFEGADLKWQPFSIQPFRDEISRIIAIYLAEGSPRELNLSCRDRTVVIKALAQTTHPSAMKHVKLHIEDLLRFQSHPNFIRWSICNGNKARGIFAIWLGLFCILLGLVASIIITLGSAGRAWRVMGAIGWVIGGATLFAGTKGLCVVLHGRHRRHVRPWELWRDANDPWGCEMKNSTKEAFEILGTSNSYEDEPWVEEYQQRNILRKIFDKEIYIEEPALKSIQDTIMLQSVIIAVSSSIILSGIFVSVPAGNFY